MRRAWPVGNGEGGWHEHEARPGGKRNTRGGTMSDTHGTQSRASPSPPAPRHWLSRRQRQEIRRTVKDFRNDDDVYSVSRHGTTVVLMRHRNEHRNAQAPTKQPAGNQRQQQEAHAQSNSGSRKQKIAERSAERARKWHAAQNLLPHNDANPSAATQQQPGNQLQLPPPPEATPTSTKRSCSATATPTKARERSEDSSDMEASLTASSSAAHGREGAQRARMHSPGGGPATGLLQRPGPASAGGGPPQPGPASAGRPTQLLQLTPAQPAAPMPLCNGSMQPHTMYQGMLEHMRTIEYPQFMQHHMQQGMPQQMAHARWVEYERFRMSGAQVSGR